MRRNVARDPRVRIVAPRSADAVCALEDGEVVDAGLLQANRHAETGEARPDDDHVVGIASRRTIEPGSGARAGGDRCLHGHRSTVASVEWPSKSTRLRGQATRVLLLGGIPRKGPKWIETP